MTTLSRIVAALTVVLLAGGAAQPLAAQGLGLEIDAGYMDITNASDSATAVLGKSGGFTWGGALRYELTENLYASIGARRFDAEGERVFVADAAGSVFPLGHPLTLRVTPLRLNLGYRFDLGSFTPFAGGGVGLVKYREESTVGGVTEIANESHTSYHLLAGLEYGGGALRLGAELSYSWVPNAIGIGGVSEVYGETDIGGLAAVGKLVLTLAR